MAIFSNLFNKSKSDGLETSKLLAALKAGDLATVVNIGHAKPDVYLDALPHTDTSENAQYLMTMPTVAVALTDVKTLHGVLHSAIFFNNIAPVELLLKKANEQKDSEARQDNEHAFTRELKEILSDGDEKKIQIAQLLVKYGADVDAAKGFAEIDNVRLKQRIASREKCLAAVMPAIAPASPKPPR